MTVRIDMLSYLYTVRSQIHVFGDERISAPKN